MAVRLLSMLNPSQMWLRATHSASLRNLLVRPAPLSHARTARSFVRPRIRMFQLGYERVKRTFDLCVCLALVPLVVPVLSVCALLIRLDTPGPVFFRQLRTGKHGRRFRLYKFRTMVADAPARKRELMHLNRQSGPDFKVDDDPRITRVGRVLRRTSLDELPQILNVIRGEMSLVGPRPTSFAASTYELWHTERLEVTPGITGLWQVSGRSDVDFDERVRLDIEYIQTRSMKTDLVILWRTVAAVFDQRGAY
jgi:lipopolysaccharide/colanic/teichoic acid biosynthesis glycosyltransferase